MSFYFSWKMSTSSFRNLCSFVLSGGQKTGRNNTLFHIVPFTLFINSLVLGLCHVILRHYENLTKSGMPRGCKLPWVMYEEQVIKWNEAIWLVHKCSHKCSIKNITWESRNEDILLHLTFCRHSSSRGSAM